jgi:hypothetical protein
MAIVGKSFKIFRKVRALEEAECIYVGEHTEQWHINVNKVMGDLSALSKSVTI